MEAAVVSSTEGVLCILLGKLGDVIASNRSATALTVLRSGLSLGRALRAANQLNHGDIQAESLREPRQVRRRRPRSCHHPFPLPLFSTAVTPSSGSANSSARLPGLAAAALTIAARSSLASRPRLPPLPLTVGSSMRPLVGDGGSVVVASSLV
nr:unnamed protein product [Digitaria exilis]